MRILIKILLFPFSILLTIIVTVSMLAVERFAGILNVLSGIMFIAAVVGYAQYLFGWPVGAAGNAPTLQLAVIGTVIAFILSPYGLPTLVAWLLGKLDNLNSEIKSI